MPTLDERIKAARKLEGYTPGPWGRDCWDVLGKGQGTGQVCEVTIPNGDDDMFWKPGECEGNVTLIAAAPDLHCLALDLAAERERLLATLRRIAGKGDQVYCRDGHEECALLARAALAPEPRA